MIERNVGEVDWENTYYAENRLVEVEIDGVTENRYYYDGDGNRVARLGADNTGTVFIGNYFDAVYPHDTIPDPPPVTEGVGEENEPNAPNPIPQGDITYYYADGQRIAMFEANVAEDWDIANMRVGEAIINTPGYEPFLFRFDKVK